MSETVESSPSLPEGSFHDETAKIDEPKCTPECAEIIVEDCNASACGTEGHAPSGTPSITNAENEEQSMNNDHLNTEAVSSPEVPQEQNVHRNSVEKETVAEAITYVAETAGDACPIQKPQPHQCDPPSPSAITSDVKTHPDSALIAKETPSELNVPVQHVVKNSGEALDLQLPRSAPNNVCNAPKDIVEVKVNEAAIVSRLEQEMRKRTIERDVYKKKLEEAEKRVSILQTSYDAIKFLEGEDNTLGMMEQLKNKLLQTAVQLEERNRIVANQENQINALNNQVTSLKKVVSITKDLLQVRNLEVKHLQIEVDDMEKRISEERERHNTMISKMDSAVRLNADLKKEYETQLCLFQNLREKYEEKVTLLSEEKRALESAAQSVTK